MGSSKGGGTQAIELSPEEKRLMEISANSATELQKIASEEYKWGLEDRMLMEAGFQGGVDFESEGFRTMTESMMFKKAGLMSFEEWKANGKKFEKPEETSKKTTALKYEDDGDVGFDIEDFARGGDGYDGGFGGVSTAERNRQDSYGGGSGSFGGDMGI